MNDVWSEVVQHALQSTDGRASKIHCHAGDAHGAHGVNPCTFNEVVGCWVRRDDVYVVASGDQVSRGSKNRPRHSIDSRKERFRDHGDPHNHTVAMATRPAVAQWCRVDGAEMNTSVTGSSSPGRLPVRT